MEDHNVDPYMAQYLFAVRAEYNRRIIEKKHFDLTKLFNYKNIDYSDLYDPIVFRSTHKKREDSPSEEVAFEKILSPDFLEGMVAEEGGEFEITPQEFGQKLLKEFQKEGDEFFLYHQDITRYVVYEDHDYDAGILGFDESDTEIIGDEDNRIKKSTEQVLLNYQVNKNGLSQRKVDFYDNESGYFVPKFNFLRLDKDFKDVENQYEDAKEDFKLSGDYDYTAALAIGNYRDLLSKQLSRQIDQLSYINEFFLNSLNIFYVNIEENIKKAWQQTKVGKDGYIETSDWHIILHMSRDIYDTFYLNKDDKVSLKYYEKNISKIPYVSSKVKETFLSNMHHFHYKKKPILDVARKLALKFTICESLLEDLLLSEPIKTFDEFSSSLKIELTREDIIKKTFALQSKGMKWKEVFKEIKDWLLREHGLDEDSVKRKYDIGLSDYEAFSRVMNKNKI